MLSHDGKSTGNMLAKRSSLFTSNSQDKRNLWWRAFRKTVLEPHAIAILETPMTDKVPQEVLQLVEVKCQSLEKHERQALDFIDSVTLGRGFNQSSIFPHSVIPKLDHPLIVRCLEAEYDSQTLLVREDGFSAPLFDLPVPRPGLASGFSVEAFAGNELKEIPAILTATGTLVNNTDGNVQMNYGLYAPFLLFERTYGHAKHEIEAAMNYCAMNGAAALKSIANLYESAWPEGNSRTIDSPVVFSCIIDNDLGIINHHWISEGGFYAAPLCKFDCRDVEHLMHFLAWIEAIEQWAISSLLPDIRKALQVFLDQKDVGMGLKALPSPVSVAEKEEKLSQAMRLAFDNIPWKGERSRKTPLAVTGTMRMRSPKVQAETESVVTPLTLVHQLSPSPEKLFEVKEQEDVAETDGAALTLKSSTSQDSGDSQRLDQMTMSDPVLISVENKSQDMMGFVLPVAIPEEEVVAKRKKSRLGLSLIKSAGLPKPTEFTKETRSISSAGFDASKSPAASIRTMPVMRPENGKSPGIAAGISEMRSPAQSLASVSSKRSFSSLRRGKKLKSPNTPDFGGSPKENGFKSKLANSLDIIKEHTTPKRQFADNSAPSSAKGSALPTPMYDKKRFDIKTPKPILPTTPASIPESFKNMALPMPNSRPYMPQRPATSANITSQDDYDANHQLPLRQWAKSPTSAVTNTTTLTTFI